MGEMIGGMFFGMVVEICIALILILDPGIQHNFQAQIWPTHQVLFMQEMTDGMFFGDIWMDLCIALILILDPGIHANFQAQM